MKVFLWPRSVGSSRLYSQPHRNRITEQWSGAPGQITAQIPRAQCTISGTVAGRYDQAGGKGADLDIILDQIEGGRSLVAVWDSAMRMQSGWSSAVANTGDNEVWRVDGQTRLWAGEAADGTTWRSVFVSGSGSAGSAGLSVTGLLTGEVIPKGTWVRVDDNRYRVAATVAESGGGASLTLSRPLEAAPTGSIRLPGDFFVGRIIGQPEVGPDQVGQGRTFSVDLIEVYASEVDGGFEYQ